MKQIIIIADMNRWGQEANLLGDMLHLTATTATTLNIGSRKAIADLQGEEILKLFPGNTLAESIHLALVKLQRQGLIDGIIALIGHEPRLYGLLARAFDALPFGLPKIAVLGGNCRWQANKDVLPFFLPGSGYSLNPAINILLGNAAFALSGMALASRENFSCRRPTVGCLSAKAMVGKYLSEAGLDYICFAREDQLLGALVRDGYVQGLIMPAEVSSPRFFRELRGSEVPVVLTCPDPHKAMDQSALLPSDYPLTIISPRCQEKVGICTGDASRPSSRHGRRFLSIVYRYGSERFYRFAVRVLADQLAQSENDDRQLP